MPLLGSQHPFPHLKWRDKAKMASEPWLAVHLVLRSAETLKCGVPRGGVPGLEEGRPSPPPAERFTSG